jgi:protein-tyrosine-phosphatase
VKNTEIDEAYKELKLVLKSKEFTEEEMEDFEYIYFEAKDNQQHVRRLQAEQFKHFKALCDLVQFNLDNNYNLPDWCKGFLKFLTPYKSKRNDV